MTIKDFYQRQGTRGLNISLFFIGMAIICLLLLRKISFPVVVIPFMLISSIYFVIHLYYWTKAHKTTAIDQEKLAVHDYHLIEFDGSDVYLFRPNGIDQGNIKIHSTIRGIQIEYFDEHGHRNKYFLKKAKNGYQVDAVNRGKRFLIQREKKPLFSRIEIDDEMIFVYYFQINSLTFQKDGRLIARMQKGWMPLAWQQIFRLNTPVVTFYETVDFYEKEAIYLVILLYLYFN